ncbi:MAG TPA: hypothetical protein VH442_16705 [Micromonosporaceae bacterium]
MTELVRVTRGVWRPRLVVADLAGRVAALLTVYPDDTVVCGLTAARLHGLWLPSDAQRAEELIELIIHPGVPMPSRRTASHRTRVRARRQMLRPDEVVRLDGIPVTSEARTWLDLAACLQLPDLVAAGDCALRGSATPQQLELLVRRAVHRRGVVNARAALALLDGRSRSRPESHLRYALVSRGLPKPEVNEPILSEYGEWLAEPDLSYEDVRLALEYNGADHADTARMRRDLTRGVDISFAGWRTETFGPTEVFKRPDQIAALVRQLRRERTGARRIDLATTR